MRTFLYYSLFSYRLQEKLPCIAGKVCYNTIGDEMDRKNIDKISETPEDRLLLAKLWDKLQSGMRKNICASTCFLSPREQQLAQLLFGNAEGLYFYGGYSEAERKMLSFLPDYMEENDLSRENSPIVCLRADFYREDFPSHRDFLGALIGCGISREAIGDILVGENSCDFFVSAEIAPYILQSLKSAGRTHLKLRQIPLSDVAVPEQSFTEIQDTVASIRLDSLLSAGFRISRSLASEYIAAEKVAIDGLPCIKPEKAVEEGSKLSIRGLGKMKLSKIGHTTKKGRIAVIIHRYN